MSKKNKQYTEKNPFLMVLYIIAAAALIACLVWMAARARQRDAEYEETLAQLAMEETEYVREIRQETETESETAADTAETSAETGTTEVAQVGLESASLEASNVKDTTILVLNGTERSGVAGYWKTQLEEAGYTDVTPASYQQSAGQQTVVYTDNALCAEELKEIFPDALYQTGTPEGNYTLEDTVEEPGEIEAYIVIGTDDASYEETTT